MCESIVRLGPTTKKRLTLQEAFFLKPEFFVIAKFENLEDPGLHVYLPSKVLPETSTCDMILVIIYTFTLEGT